MDNNIDFFNSKYINTQLGLKYLNNNKKLYLKILKNFVNRYKDLNIETLNRDSLKDTIHTIKGLSATLGMSTLSQLATTIYQTNNINLLPEFSKELTNITDELDTKFKTYKQKTILIISDKVIDIDILFELLVEKYDIIVALDKKSAIESINTENISTIILETEMINCNSLDIYQSIRLKKIPTLFIIDDLKNTNITDKIPLHQIIQKPFNKKKLINLINTH